MEQIYKANLLNNFDHADAIIFVYKKTIFELFEYNGTTTVELGGRSILSNIIESNKGPNNIFQMENDDFKHFFRLITKSVNLLLCWKEPYLDKLSFREDSKNIDEHTNKTTSDIQIYDTTESYTMRIEFCQRLLENILKNIDKLGWLIECLEIIYQRLSWNNQLWKIFLDDILLDVTKRNKKIGANQLDEFILFFNMEKYALQEKINKNDVQYLLKWCKETVGFP
jgi:hypothetical protein